jgi:hypothetical protein
MKAHIDAGRKRRASPSCAQEVWRDDIQEATLVPSAVCVESRVRGRDRVAGSGDARNRAGQHAGLELRGFSLDGLRVRLRRDHGVCRTRRVRLGCAPFAHRFAVRARLGGGVGRLPKRQPPHRACVRCPGEHRGPLAAAAGADRRTKPLSTGTTGPGVPQTVRRHEPVGVGRGQGRRQIRHDLGSGDRLETRPSRRGKT